MYYKGDMKQFKFFEMEKLKLCSCDKIVVAWLEIEVAWQL